MSRPGAAQLFILETCCWMSVLVAYIALGGCYGLIVALPATWHWCYLKLLVS